MRFTKNKCFNLVFLLFFFTTFSLILKNYYEKNFKKFNELIKIKNLEINYLRNQILNLDLKNSLNNSYIRFIDSPINFNYFNQLNINLLLILSLLLFKNQTLTIEPAYIHPKKISRQNVDIVFGIPTIKREKNFYLLQTIKNLIDNLDNDYKNNTLFVIMIAEFDLEYVKEIAFKLEERLFSYIKNGLIEIISPYINFYPNFDLINLNENDHMNDSIDRIKWRTKQNLDYAYLMMYCKNRGHFYIQLEDDILAVPNYYKLIKNFIYKKTIQKKDWFIIEFSNLGFIGRLFRSKDLSIFINFFLIFYRDKPVDWLMNNVISVKYCRNDDSQILCEKKKLNHVISYIPPLFQHVGIISSMKGKIQKLKVKGIKLINFKPHFDNPPCKIETNIISYNSMTINNIYKGYSIFHGITPKIGNYIIFKFDHPIVIKHYLFKSGSWDYPLDVFNNTTFSVLPVNKANIKKDNIYPKNSKGYYVVDEFNLSKNILEGSLIQFGALHSISLDVKSDLNNWVILSEV